VVAIYIYTLVPEFFCDSCAGCLVHTLFAEKCACGLSRIGRGTDRVQHVSFVVRPGDLRILRRPIRFIMDEAIFARAIIRTLASGMKPSIRLGEHDPPSWSEPFK